MKNPTLAQALREKRKEYKEFSKLWQDCLNWYEGRDIAQYLHKHTREQQPDFDNRKKRVFWFNYCSPIVDLYMSYVFRHPIERIPAQVEEDEVTPVLKEEEPVPGAPPPEEEFPSPDELGNYSSEPKITPHEEKQGELLKEWEEKKKRKKSSEAQFVEEFWKDVDNKGTEINDYMKLAGTYAQIMGAYGVLVDMPVAAVEQEEGMPVKALSNVEMTEADRIEKKLRPYCVKVDPRNLTNWAIDKDGKWLWVRIKEDAPPHEDPFTPAEPIEGTPAASVKPESEYYLTWTKAAWFRHKVTDDDVEDLSQGDNPLGEVPLVLVYNDTSKKYDVIGKSALNEVGQINVSVLNWLSLIDEDMYQKCLSLLCMQSTPGDDLSTVTIGANNVLTYSGTVAPQFINPATTPGEFIKSMIEKAVDEIYRIAKLGGYSGVKNKESKSGVAYGYEFNETNQALSDKADNLEAAEREIVRLVMKWQGKDFTGSIDYPDDFAVETFSDEIKLTTEAKGAVRSQTFKRELERQLVRKLMPKSSETLIRAIDLEITKEKEPPPAFIPFGG